MIFCYTEGIVGANLRLQRNGFGHFSNHSPLKPTAVTVVGRCNTEEEVSLVSQSKEIVQAKRMLLALVAQKKAAALANSK